MSASRRLRPWARHFARACAQLRVRAAVQTSAAAAVEKRYSEPHRHYHTLDHLDEMCSLLERHEAAIVDYPAVVMVYAATSSRARSRVPVRSLACHMCCVVYRGIARSVCHGVVWCSARCSFLYVDGGYFTCETRFIVAQFDARVS